PRNDFLATRVVVVPKEVLGDGVAAHAVRLFRDGVHVFALVSNDPHIGYQVKLRTLQAELEKVAFEQQDRPDPAPMRAHFADAAITQSTGTAVQDAVGLPFGVPPTVMLVGASGRLALTALSPFGADYYARVAAEKATSSAQLE